MLRPCVFDIICSINFDFLGQESLGCNLAQRRYKAEPDLGQWIGLLWTALSVWQQLTLPIKTEKVDLAQRL